MTTARASAIFMELILSGFETRAQHNEPARRLVTQLAPRPRWRWLRRRRYITTRFRGRHRARAVHAPAWQRCARRSAPIGWPSAQAPPFDVGACVVEAHVAHGRHGHRRRMPRSPRRDARPPPSSPSCVEQLLDGAGRGGGEPLRLAARSSRSRAMRASGLMPRRCASAADMQHRGGSAVGNRRRGRRGHRAVLAERGFQRRDLG